MLSILKALWWVCTSPACGHLLFPRHSVSFIRSYHTGHLHVLSFRDFAFFLLSQMQLSSNES